LQVENGRSVTEALYREYHAEIENSIARWSRDEYTAKDAVHTAFLRALTSGVLEAMPERAACAWLFTTARNILTDDKRKLARLLSIDDLRDLDDIQSRQTPDPVDIILLESLLKNLTEEQQQIVKMRHIAGLTSAEIGIVLKMPPATVRTTLHAAMLKMQKAATNIR
jgi:RNA polymerase sigma-70 factor (ECF subfamily)